MSIQIERNAMTVRLSSGSKHCELTIVPDVQRFFIRSQNNEVAKSYFRYKEVMKELFEHLGLEWKAVPTGTKRELTLLQMALITEYSPAKTLLLLKAQFKATGDYQPVPKPAESIPFYAFKDILKYRMAAIAFRAVLSADENFRDWFEGAGVGFEALLSHCTKNWRALLSDTKQPYRALNKTLDTWHGTAPLKISALKHFHLEKPLGALQVSLLIELASIRYDNNKHLAHIIQHSPSAEIRMLLSLPKFQGGHNSAAHQFLEYLRDGEQLCTQEGETDFSNNRSLYDMWRRSEESHERQAWRAEYRAAIEKKKLLESRAEWMKTQTPPFPSDWLPDLGEEASIEYLDSVSRIYDEGSRMKHCVYDLYAARAVAGECFLFHIDYKGVPATAELSPTGEILQVQSIQNTKNAATEFVWQALKGWGTQWDIATLRMLAKQSKKQGAMTEVQTKDT